MYLINVQTFELEEFIEGRIPSYAILSHRWGSEELNFKDVSKRRIDKTKRGFRKLNSACSVAMGHDVKYIWIDTCCIDKKSSAELSEAVNSMFSWYQDAKICLAYLEDVGDGLSNKSFQDSEWFGRSWTLQELLAPRNLHFYDGKWKQLGTRESMADDITAATLIPKDALLKKAELWSFPIAVRMSWASNRKATRTEDIAYSLLGIFDINMPLLYGEGNKAFIRLQEEIIRRSRDPSFLLWGLHKTSHNLLASSPAEFTGYPQGLRLFSRSNALFSLTNVGLDIELWMLRWQMNTYAAMIATISSDCYVVLLRKHPLSDLLYRVGAAVLRCDFSSPLVWDVKRKATIMWASKEQGLLRDIGEHDKLEDIIYGFGIRTEKSLSVQPLYHNLQHSVHFAGEEAQWSASSSPYVLNCTFDNPVYKRIAQMKCKVGHSECLWMDLCFDFDFRPCVHIRKSASPVSYQAVREASVVDLCEMVDWQQQSSRSSWGQYQMVTVRDEQTGQASYLFRNPHRARVCSPIPKDLLPRGHKVWVSFVPPRWYRKQKKFWVFKVSGHKS